ncbi:MAG: hypothetical protein DHS80DRAFT_20284 [Piptocephalis tieghemiana]|nr:MAG: hypothetical protein DHS80DRAFT_20284 [Piptocephalis tieghemiana]
MPTLPVSLGGGGGVDDRIVSGTISPPDSACSTVTAGSSPSSSPPPPSRLSSIPAPSPPPETLDEALDRYDDIRRILGPTKMSEQEKRNRLNGIFARVCSNGDIDQVDAILRDCKPWIDLNAQDDDGTTPLIYATCFGHVDVAYTLLVAGAEVNAQDKSGWSALMWATSNNYDGLARTLLEHGASTTTQTNSGRSVIQYVRHAYQHEPSKARMIEAFSTPFGDGSEPSLLSESGAAGYYSASPVVRNPGKSSGIPGEGSSEMEEKAMREAVENADRLEMNLTELAESSGMDGEGDEAGEDAVTDTDFDWETCQPGQMFVFFPGDEEKIVNVVVDQMKPFCSQEYRHAPANVLFLSARYAHYYGTPDMLQDLLEGAINRISELIERNKEVPFLAFWIGNTTQLLHYLKRDSGLVHATVDVQLRLSELIHDIFTNLVQDMSRRIGEVLEMGLLHHEPIPLDDLKFQREHRRSFIFSGGILGSTKFGRKASNSNASRRSLHPGALSGPKAITALLNSTLFVAQTYGVHPRIIHHTLNQLLYSISAEVFNRILTTRSLCCRSKAMQVRMNLASVEDWVRQTKLPSSLLSHLKAPIQLLQLLQCLTGLGELGGYIETINQMDRINPVQIRQAVLMYRYEVGEAKVPDPIMEAEETPMARDFSVKDMDDQGQLSQNRQAEELMDPTHLLPFKVPTAGEMQSLWGNSSTWGVVSPKAAPAPFIPESMWDRLAPTSRD